MKRLNFIGTLCLLLSICLTQPIEAQKNYYRTNGEEEVYNLPVKGEYDGTIKVLFNIYTNDKLIERDNIKFEIVNKAKGLNTKLDMSESFTAFLRYGQIYTFKIGHKDYNTKSIDIITSAPEGEPWTLTANIYLYDNEPDSYAGKFAYVKKDKTFKHLH